MYEEYADPELIRFWKQGELAAFEQIYKRYVVRLVHQANIKVGDNDIAQEIVQDTFISLFMNKSNIQTHTSLQNYLFTILKNAVFNHKRKELVRYKYNEELLKLEITEDNLIIENIDASALKSFIDLQIENLPTQCKAVFKLSRQENKSHKEIAEKLSISTNTVEQHIRKARRILKENLKEFIIFLIIYKMY